MPGLEGARWKIGSRGKAREEDLAMRIAAYRAGLEAEDARVRRNCPCGVSEHRGKEGGCAGAELPLRGGVAGRSARADDSLRAVLRASSRGFEEALSFSPRHRSSAASVVSPPRCSPPPGLPASPALPAASAPPRLSVPLPPASCSPSRDVVASPPARFASVAFSSPPCRSPQSLPSSASRKVLWAPPSSGSDWEVPLDFLASLAVNARVPRRRFGAIALQATRVNRHVAAATVVLCVAHLLREGRLSALGGFCVDGALAVLGFAARSIALGRAAARKRVRMRGWEGTSGGRAGARGGGEKKGGEEVESTCGIEGAAMGTREGSECSPFSLGARACHASGTALTGPVSLAACRPDFFPRSPLGAAAGFLQLALATLLLSPLLSTLTANVAGDSVVALSLFLLTGHLYCADYSGEWFEAPERSGSAAGDAGSNATRSRRAQRDAEEKRATVGSVRAGYGCAETTFPPTLPHESCQPFSRPPAASSLRLSSPLSPPPQDGRRPAFALGAALAASVLLASRLPSPAHAAALMLLSLLAYALSPAAAPAARAAGELWQAAEAAGHCLLALAFVLACSRAAAAVYLFCALFIGLAAPLWLARARKFKALINGPWDEAVPRMR